MNAFVLSVGTVSLTAALSLSGTTPVAAAQPYDPNVERVANPANACASIPGSVPLVAAFLGAPTPDVSTFDYAGCVRTLAQKAASVPGEGSPYEQCEFLVNVGAFSYPATLHSGEAGAEDVALPDLLVRNTRECGSALYAYHSIFSFFGPPA